MNITVSRAKDIDVLCAGMIVYDVMAKPVDEIPDWGRLATLKQVEHHVGGCAVNTGIDLARLARGRMTVALAGCLGRDGAAQFVKSRLAGQGLDIAPIIETDRAGTSYTFVMIGSDGRRRYFHHVGANAFFNDEDVPDAWLERARILHFGGAFLMPGMDGTPCANLLRRARERGVVTFLDTAYNPAADAGALIKPCAPYLDVFVPSIEEAELITGRKDPAAILDSLSELGIPVTGIKLGEAGCIIRTEDGTRSYPAFHVDVVDSSGAGDAFMAGFIYATAQGWPSDRRALFANAVAAHCIGAVGCNTGVPAAEDVLEFMEAAGGTS